MKERFYEAIFRRKSFHLFRNVGTEQISPEELDGIEKAYAEAERLCPEIGTAIRIVSTKEAALKPDAEYCILIYSEKKENYLMNVGYVGEQLDLYLVSRNIGSLWFGIGKPDEPTYKGMDFAIMLAIRKVDDATKFRKDMFRAKRKPLDEIWSGPDLDVADIARFAPSACNSQPWRVENKSGELTVFRYRKQGLIGLMPPTAASYFNRIDMGIYLCILEICLQKNGITYGRTLFSDESGEAELTRVAVYGIETGRAQDG